MITERSRSYWMKRIDRGLKPNEAKFLLNAYLRESNRVRECWAEIGRIEARFSARIIALQDHIIELQGGRVRPSAPEKPL